MSLWMVRAGKHGDQETVALEKCVITIGWNEFPDLSLIKTREALESQYQKLFPGSSKSKSGNEIGQIWRFIHDIKKGDFVALPLKTQSAIAIGKVMGNYQYKTLAENVKHIRKVKWIKTYPRSSFDQDLLYSFGAFMTVCQINRNNAENRIEAILYGKRLKPAIDESIEDEIDVEQYARDQILNYIGKKFKGHDLARLVEAILSAQRYVTKKSKPGPDGGIDILAAAGDLGFDDPRICVQVKSSSSAADVKILRELRGVMAKVGAEQGLLVSWGGFTSNTIQEARDSFFSTRLWDADELLEAVFDNYEQFDDELKAELPLKKIWALVLEE